MNIREVRESNQGQFVKFNAVLVDKVESETSTSSKMVTIKMVDKTGMLTTPIFDSSMIVKLTTMETMRVYSFRATVNKWKDVTQLKDVQMTELKESEYDSSEFIESYDVDKKDIEFFESIIKSMQEKYRDVVIHALGMNGKDDLAFSKFMRAPSAEKHHGAKINGLFLHTVGVIKNILSIVRIYESYQNINVDKYVNIDRLLLKAILHDIEKRNEYEYDVAIKRKKNVIGHIYDGITILVNSNNATGNKISDEEIENIKIGMLSHHGAYGPMEPKNVEDMLLHLADMIDSRMVGEIDAQLNMKESEEV